MKIKSLLLGSAAATIAATSVHAADLPSVEPVNYVKVCDSIGSGFFALGASENCIKFSGFVRLDIEYQNEDGAAQGSDFEFDARARYNIDVRRVTEYGLLRAFIRLQGDYAPGESSTNVFIDDSFLSLGNFTFGEVSDPANLAGGPSDIGPARTDNTYLGVRYDGSFGDFGYSVAVLDPAFNTTDSYDAPNFGGALTYSNDTFSAKLGATAVNVNSDGLADTETNYGFAVAGSVEFNPGDLSVLLGATYVENASNHYFGFNNTIVVGVDADGNNITAETNEDGYSAFVSLAYSVSDNVSVYGLANYIDIDDTDIEGIRLAAGVDYSPVADFNIIGEVSYQEEDLVGGADDEINVLLRFVRSF